MSHDLTDNSSNMSTISKLLQSINQPAAASQEEKEVGLRHLDLDELLESPTPFRSSTCVSSTDNSFADFTPSSSAIDSRFQPSSTSRSQVCKRDPQMPGGKSDLHSVSEDKFNSNCKPKQQLFKTDLQSSGSTLAQKGPQEKQKSVKSAVVTHMQTDKQHAKVVPSDSARPHTHSTHAPLPHTHSAHAPLPHTHSTHAPLPHTLLTSNNNNKPPPNPNRVPTAALNSFLLTPSHKPPGRHQLAFHPHHGVSNRKPLQPKQCSSSAMKPLRTSTVTECDETPVSDVRAHTTVNTTANSVQHQPEQLPHFLQNQSNRCRPPVLDLNQSITQHTNTTSRTADQSLNSACNTTNLDLSILNTTESSRTGRTRATGPQSLLLGSSQAHGHSKAGLDTNAMPNTTPITQAQHTTAAHHLVCNRAASAAGFYGNGSASSGSDRAPQSICTQSTATSDAESAQHNMNRTTGSSTNPPNAPLMQTPVAAPAYAMSIPSSIGSAQSEPASATPVHHNIIVVNGRQFQKFESIGKGGSSQVFEVLDIERNVTVALKQVDLRGLDEAVRKAYMDEIHLLQKLQSHPAERVVKMHTFEMQTLADGHEYLNVVMEKGDSDFATFLKVRRQKNKRLTRSMIAYHWEEMLRCVQMIHEENVIHSDLKPANFLFVAGQLKLIDFGIASSVPNEQTSVFKDSQMGTINYMSPEAIQQNSLYAKFKVSAKSDVWSLGCILYSLCYDKTPFQSIRGNVQKMWAIPDPNVKIQFDPLDDPHLIRVLKWCLERDPRDRPTVDQLLNDEYLHKAEDKLALPQSLAENCSPVRPDDSSLKALQKQMAMQTPRTLSKVKEMMK